MKNIIFILAIFMHNSVLSEELVEFKHTETTYKSENVETVKQSEWITINDSMGASYFRAHNSRSSPTIILLHGSGGVGDREFHYAYRLQKLGFNTVIVDSFKHRGIINLLGSARPALLPTQRSQTDVPDIIHWVKKQPWHSGSIGMVGWSHGGTTLLESSHNLKNLGVDGIVAFYPQAYRWHNKTTVPVEIHHGTADNWTSYEASLNLSKPGLFYKPNPLIKLWSYQDGHHGFDHQGWHFKLFGWGEDGYRLRTVAPHPEADLAKKRTEEFFLRTLNGSN